MHESPRVKLGCTDCHGGNAGVGAGGAAPGSDAYVAARDEAHVQPEYPERWENAQGQPSSANPVRSYTLLNEESPESSGSSIPAISASRLRPAAKPAAIPRRCSRSRRAS
jgi:hypothetical protein